MLLYRQIFFLALLTWQLQASSQLPACKDSFPSSLLLNNSFEEYSRCSIWLYYEGGKIDASANYDGITVNHWRSFGGATWCVDYFNYNCQSHTLGSIFDTAAFQIDKPVPIIIHGYPCLYLMERDLLEFMKTVEM